jgi:hypothetical protein
VIQSVYIYCRSSKVRRSFFFYSRIDRAKTSSNERHLCAGKATGRPQEIYHILSINQSHYTNQITEPAMTNKRKVEGDYIKRSDRPRHPSSSNIKMVYSVIHMLPRPAPSRNTTSSSRSNRCNSCPRSKARYRTIITTSIPWQDAFKYLLRAAYFKRVWIL